jgi:hypothetical protein
VRTVTMIGLCVVLLAGCDQDKAIPPEDANDQYRQGYDMGHAAGVVEEHAELCAQIANFRAGMAAQLREAGICPKSQ